MLFSIGICLMAGFSLPVQAGYLLEEQPHLRDSILVVSDLFNIGRSQIVAGRENEVSIYDEGELVATIAGFAGNVTALAAGDLTGDFRPEIVIGTDNYSYYVYQSVRGAWRQISEQRYLWSPVVDLKIADITGNGWGDVVVRTERGEAFIYLSWGGGLDLFWRSQPNANVKYVCVGDLDGVGGAEVIFTYHSGYVGVLGWVDGQLELLGQNYPWGTIDSVFLVKAVPDELPELAVVTGQNIFYAWKYTGDNLVTVRHFPVDLDGHIIKYLPQLGIVNMSGRSGITTYALGSGALNKVASLALFNVQDLVVFDDTFLVQETDGSCYLLHQVDPDEIELLINNRTVTESLGIKLHNGRLYLDLDGLASLLGLIQFGSKRIFLISGLNYMVIDPGEGVLTWRDTVVPLAENVLAEDSRFYLPISLLSVFGYETEYDYEANRLVINRSWGWWW